MEPLARGLFKNLAYSLRSLYDNYGDGEGVILPACSTTALREE
jgi:hypothetical protein